MQVVTTTSEKVVVEITINDINEKGFDALWDDIREIYTIDEYDVFSFERNKGNNKIFYCELIKKRKGKK